MEARSTKPAAKSGARLANWDLLRALSMFLVVVVHSSALFPRQLPGFDASTAVRSAAIVCDPAFFMLSGFFALRPMRGSLGAYYLKKLSTVLLPLIVYSVVLYVAEPRPAPAPGGFLPYAAGLLAGGWWFVPTLVPMLVLAPFMFRALEALDDAWVLRLSRLLAALYVWGAVLHVLMFVARAAGSPALVGLLDVLARCVPTMAPGGYLPVFVMGYLYRRLSALLDEGHKRRIACLGVVAWVLCFVCGGLGLPGDDPNQLWVIAAFGLFFAFERVRVPAGLAERATVWAAKRSFAVYLLQFTTIALVRGAVYERMLLGDVTALPALPAIALWGAVVVAAYLLALLAASVLDPTVVAGAQRLFDRLVAAPLLRREERGVI